LGRGRCWDSSVAAPVKEQGNQTPLLNTCPGHLYLVPFSCQKLQIFNRGASLIPFPFSPLLVDGQYYP
jgi:hypothetical protein